MASSGNKMMTLTSSEGKSFQVETAVMLQSQTIKDRIETDCQIATLSLNITTGILEKIIDYCQKHAETPNPDDPASEMKIKAWDANFVTVDQETLFDLVRAADYLKINSLLDLTCQAVQEMVKGKNPKEIRSIFNISDTYSPEEEETLRRENPELFE